MKSSCEVYNGGLQPVVFCSRIVVELVVVVVLEHNIPSQVVDSHQKPEDFEPIAIFHGRTILIGPRIVLGSYWSRLC
jgi:hypothetical protein